MEGDTEELWGLRHTGLSPVQGMPLPTGDTLARVIPSSPKRTDPLALPQPWEEANQSHPHHAGGSARPSLLPPVWGSRTQASPSHPGTALADRQPRGARTVSAGEGSMPRRERLARVVREEGAKEAATQCVSISRPKSTPSDCTPNSQLLRGLRHPGFSPWLLRRLWHPRCSPCWEPPPVSRPLAPT